MRKLTAYQKWILEEMKNGAVIDCTEGANYKVWLTRPDGNATTIRRDTANILTSMPDFKGYFRFNNAGISLIKCPVFD